MVEIEAGKWYRTPEGQPVRTELMWPASGRWRVEGIDGHGWTWPAEQLTPWVPKVGEWVTVTNRDDGPGPVRVLRVIEDLAYFSEEALACAGCFRGGVGYPDAMRVEPCLPPAEKTSAVQTTTTWNEAGGAIVPESVRVEAMTSGGIAAAVGANGTCPKCGGPAYVGLNNTECLAPKCERVEPEPMVCRSWIGFCHPPDLDGAVRSEVPEWEDGAEPFWTAYGLGISVNHPLRDEAIRLWREAVRRG